MKDHNKSSTTDNTMSKSSKKSNRTQNNNTKLSNKNRSSIIEDEKSLTFSEWVKRKDAEKRMK